MEFNNKLRPKKATASQVQDNKDHWLLKDRYAIYKDGGVVYDTKSRFWKRLPNIPQSVFKKRDKLMKGKNK